MVFPAGGDPVALRASRVNNRQARRAKMTEISLALLAGDPYWAMMPKESAAR